MPTEIQRLIAEGKEITFADGSSVRVRYGARALAKLEDHYGSLDAFLAEIAKASGGKVFHLLAYSLSVALSMPEERVWDLIDTQEAVNYLTAISVAIAEAMPGSDGPEPNGQGPAAGNALAAPSPSPGAATTTSASSSSELTPSASGA